MDDTRFTDFEERLGRLEEAVFGGNKEVKAPPKKFDGATGGIRLLIEEGFFDEPKLISEVRERLKAEGYHYGDSTIAMGLVALVKQRSLVRFKQEGQHWGYAVRK